MWAEDASKDFGTDNTNDDASDRDADDRLERATACKAAQTEVVKKLGS